MIALDTNILVRYLVQDDPVQADRAVRLFENELSSAESGFISLPVLCEMLWTLRSRYSRNPEQLRAIVAGLLKSREIVVDQADLVQAALIHREIGLTDAIIHELGRRSGCERTVTFDRDFAKLEGVELLA